MTEPYDLDAVKARHQEDCDCVSYPEFPGICDLAVTIAELGRMTGWMRLLEDAGKDGKVNDIAPYAKQALDGEPIGKHWLASRRSG